MDGKSNSSRSEVASLEEPIEMRKKKKKKSLFYAFLMYKAAAAGRPMKSRKHIQPKKSKYKSSA
jgi:hypothetical protein